MQTSLQRIANKAKRNRKYKFGNLYSLLNEENLTWCFRQMNKKASPGVDKIDYHTYGNKLVDNVTELVDTLKKKHTKQSWCAENISRKAIVNVL